MPSNSFTISGDAKFIPPKAFTIDGDAFFKPPQSFTLKGDAWFIPPHAFNLLGDAMFVPYLVKFFTIDGDAKFISKPVPPIPPQHIIRGLAGSATGASPQSFTLKHMPPIPDDFKARFPTMQQYEDDMKEWVKNLVFKKRQSMGE